MTFISATTEIDDADDDFDAAAVVRLRVRKISGDSDEIEAKETLTVGEAKLLVQGQQENISALPGWLLDNRILDDEELLKDIRPPEAANMSADVFNHIEVAAIRSPRKFCRCFEVPVRKLLPERGPTVSPEFKVRPSPNAMEIVYTIVVSPQRGGMGSIRLRFKPIPGAEGGSAQVWFRIGNSSANQTRRGPVEVHDLARGAICELAAEDARWNFRQAMDQDLQIVSISAEVAFMSEPF